MSDSATVLQSYLAAWRFRRVFVPVYLLLRLVVYGMIAPFLGLAITFAVSFSDQTALTDQDIARFIFTPAGFGVTLVVLGLLLLGEVLGLAVMTGVLRAEQASLTGALRDAFDAVARRVRSLFVFGSVYKLYAFTVCSF